MTAIPSSGKKIGLGTALPYWISLLLVPLAIWAATQGGFFILVMPFIAWYVFAGLDFIIGQDKVNADPDTPDADLLWYRLITMIWPPVQIATILGLLAYVSGTDHLSRVEEWALFASLGVLSGTIGITYAHELMHQKPKVERWLADILLASVFYSHFRSEHLLVHHRYVGTPRDPVSASYGENFWRFFLRVLKQSPVSAFRAEKAMLARKNLAWTHPSNPFWIYWGLQGAFVVIAFLIGGWWGVFLFGTQAFWAVFQLELVNYIEHYALTRKYLGDGKYEHVKPHHSWNTAYRTSNWLLINLQRHSDHHFKPSRRFPLLQNYTEDEAPQLPFSYSMMTLMALSPTGWAKMMHPRVKAWRKKHYPEITDWRPYQNRSLPMPK